MKDKRATGRPQREKLTISYLERVSWRVLDDYRGLVKSAIKGRPGVYSLYKGDRLHYVGLANNLMGRVGSHLRDRHKGKWDKFSVYVTTRDEHTREIEALVLRILDPKGNAVVGRLRHARDLKRDLNRAMREHDADHRARLLGGHVARRRRRAKTSAKTGTLVLAGIVDRRMQLRAKYKGNHYKATLRKDGWISSRGKQYKSASAAAKTIVGRAANGWSFWKFKGPKGVWVPLALLRR